MVKHYKPLIILFFLLLSNVLMAGLGISYDDASQGIKFINNDDLADQVLIEQSGLNEKRFLATGGSIALDAGTASGLSVSAGNDVHAPGMISFASTLNIEINGTLPGQYTQSTTIDLTGVTLIITGSYVPTGNEVFTIVINQSSSPVTGHFNSLPEGAEIVNFLGSHLSATITYQGGACCDVVITVESPRPPPPPQPTPTPVPLSGVFPYISFLLMLSFMILRFRRVS